MKNEGMYKVQIAPGVVSSTIEKEYNDHKEHQQWYNSHPDGKKTKNYDNSGSSSTIYKSSINLSNYKRNDTIAIFAVVEADSSWLSSWSEGNKPQSHLLNARTNPSWDYVNKYTNKYIKIHIRTIGAIRKNDVSFQLQKAEKRNHFNCLLFVHVDLKPD